MANEDGGMRASVMLVDAACVLFLGGTFDDMTRWC